MDIPLIIGRDKIQDAIPQTDCSGREYPKDEREDLVRYMLWAAEIQRDRDVDYYNQGGGSNATNGLSN